MMKMGVEVYLQSFLTSDIKKWVSDAAPAALLPEKDCLMPIDRLGGTLSWFVSCREKKTFFLLTGIEPVCFIHLDRSPVTMYSELYFWFLSLCWKVYRLTYPSLLNLVCGLGNFFNIWSA